MLKQDAGQGFALQPKEHSPSAFQVACVLLSDAIPLGDYLKGGKACRDPLFRAKQEERRFEKSSLPASRTKKCFAPYGAPAPHSLFLAIIFCCVAFFCIEWGVFEGLPALHEQESERVLFFYFLNYSRKYRTLEKAKGTELEARCPSDFNRWHPIER